MLRLQATIRHTDFGGFHVIDQNVTWLLQRERSFVFRSEGTSLVYLDLSVLSSGGQHLRVSTEAHTQHCVVHHHEVILSLVLQILQDTMQ